MALFKRRTGIEGDEMSFFDHIDVLRRHLFRSAIAIAIGATVIGIYNDFFIKKVLLGPTRADFPTYGFLCKIGKSLQLGNALCMKELAIKMQSTSVTGQFSMWITVVIVGGIIIAFPYVFWEFWRFVKPALTQKEMQNTRGVIFWVSLLFFIGVFFGFFVIAPYTLNFFGNFQLDEHIENRWTITSYIDTMIPLILGSGLAFQLPLAILFLAKVGIVTASYLRSIRKYAIVAILIIAAVITPGPDLISQLTVALPLFLLYEISIILSRRSEKKLAAEEAEWS